MLESERIAAVRRLAAGEPVPVHDVPVRIWGYERTASGSGPLGRLGGAPRIISHVVEFPGSDGMPLFADMGPLHDTSSTLRIIGWPEIGGVVAVQFPDGSRQVAEQYVSHRRPRRARPVAPHDT